MSGQPLRPVGAADHAALLALNNAHATELSWLDAPALARLLGIALHARTVGTCSALLVALDQDAPYANPNFAWFAARHRRFVYIDRVVVAASARGQGLARRLYRDLADTARAQGHSLLACEINLDPPNPASADFHRGLGFVSVGSARLPGGKQVGYHLCALDEAPRLRTAP